MLLHGREQCIVGLVNIDNLQNSLPAPAAL